MKKMVILLVMILFLITGCGTMKEERKMISYEEVNGIIENYENLEHVYIIDVREEDEYEEGHLINSYNIPLSRLEDINNENISKDAKIIIYCRSGNRSKTAQDRLNNMGYTNVYDMGGITNWPYDIV
ncbi:MAG: rhodanese-like domain-containing protein [Bacilli bacterium]|nr:rhodanese-like domain-containing protein [Bacilli bacterium]